MAFDATPATLGVVDSKFGTLGEFLEAAKTNKPDNVRICYHESSQEPNGEWKIKQDYYIDVSSFGVQVFNDCILFYYQDLILVHS